MTKNENTPEEISQKEINEEYKLWRKNVPYTYDLLITHALSWPSLSCQWYPTAEKCEDGVQQNILLSTHTSEKDQEFILVISVKIPESVIEVDEGNSYGNELSSGNTINSRIKFVQEIPVNDEINRTRYSPFANNVIVTRTDNPDIHIYDTTRHSIKSKKVVLPDLILKGHTTGGYGISWNVTKNGELISSGEDGLICFYDINASTSKNSETNSIDPIHVYNDHESVAGDCCFSFYNPNVFVSIGDDKKIIFYDSRIKKSIMTRKDAHLSDIYCVNYSPIEENLVATGGKDGKINIWDERNMNNCMHSFTTENNEVLQIQFSPHQGGIIASTGTNRKVHIWDIEQIGNEINHDNKFLEDGPPELKFIHSGHTNFVCDLSWNPLEPMEICSVAEDNIMQVWQMTSSKIPFDLSDE